MTEESTNQEQAPTTETLESFEFNKEEVELIVEGLYGINADAHRQDDDGKVEKIKELFAKLGVEVRG